MRWLPGKCSVSSWLIRLWRIVKVDNRNGFILQYHYIHLYLFNSLYCLTAMSSSGLQGEPCIGKSSNGAALGVLPKSAPCMFCDFSHIWVIWPYCHASGWFGLVTNWKCLQNVEFPWLFFGHCKCYCFYHHFSLTRSWT